MAILAAYIGLATAFTIVGFILLYFVINSKSHVILKAITITIVLWYSLVMFYIPPRLMGWPTYQSLPDESRIISVLIKEPKGDDEGSIYLVVLNADDDKKPLIQQINPKHVFNYSLKNTPRMYRVPYSREFHKKWEKAKRKAGRGGIIKLQKGKPEKRGERGNPRALKDKFNFKILNPMKLLTKD